MEKNDSAVYADHMLNRSFSRILLGVLVKTAVDYVAAANDDRKVTTRHNDKKSTRFSKILFRKNDRGENYMDYASERSGFGTGLLMGSVVGTIVGAGLALWYAPQTGKRTQDMVKREANRLQKEVNQKANNLYTTAEEIASDTVERASELSEHGREFIEDKAKTLKKAVAR
jgi:gas vesicle protein